jgi:hypothetical protein
VGVFKYFFDKKPKKCLKNAKNRQKELKKGLETTRKTNICVDKCKNDAIINT